MNVGRVKRLLKMITILRTGAPYRAEGLANKLGISRRTVFRDLKLLEEAGIPYRFEHTDGCYRIEDRLLLPPLHLNMDEALALMLATRKLISAKNHPLHEAAIEAALKIESALPSSISAHCGSWIAGLEAKLEPTSPADAITDVFRRLQVAVARRERLIMQYDSVFDGKEIRMIVDPVRLVFLTRGWYMIAKSHHHDGFRTFKLDRMVQLESTGDRFPEYKNFSLAGYFGKAWRMIPEGKMYKISLRFSRIVAPSVEEVQWHPTQETLRDNEDRLLFHAEVDGLSEIAPWVMGYGEHVEILGPGPLREVVVTKARKLIENAIGKSNEAK